MIFSLPLATLIFFVPLRLCVKNAFTFAYSAASSFTSAATALPIVQRRTYGSHPLQLRHFSSSSRAPRGIKMSIQRHYGSVPPVISADNLHKICKTKKRIQILYLRLCVASFRAAVQLIGMTA